MMKFISNLQPTKRYFLIIFLISCILLEVFTLVIYNESKINKHVNDWVIRSYEVLRLGRLTLVDSIDAANNEKDYLVTGYKSYLETYEKIYSDLVEQLGKLDKTIAGNPDQEKNFAPFRTKVVALMDITSDHVESAQKHLVSVYTIRQGEAETRQAVDDVRTAFDLFSQNEVKLLDERSHEARQQQKNYLWTLFLGGLLGLGALIFANLFIFSLISRNLNSEAKLRKSEELFSQIINGINDGVYDYDILKNTVTYSPTYEVIWGYGQDELGRNHDSFYRFVHPDDLAKAQEHMRQYMAREIPTYYNVFRVRHKDGHWVWMLSRGIGIWDESGTIQRLIGTHTDITPQKRREEELNYFIRENEHQRQELAVEKEKAEAANQAKSDFLATMSHEIRTPMNAVIGLARLLLQTKLDGKQKEMVETLRVNADVLLQLVNELLDLSRIESGQIELEVRSFTLQSVFRALKAMTENLASAKGLTLKIIDTASDRSYLGDPTRIQQILVNLVGNAIKFTAKGDITVRVEEKPLGGNKVDVHLSVSDTGVGIPPEKLSAIFEKFVQADQTISRRFGGSGLGLAICKSLAQLMGGDILVASKMNEGSTFTLYLPLKLDEQKKTVAPMPLPLAAVSTSSGTVLVVEDYAPNIMVATLMLEHLGYSSDIARNGEEAIRKIKDATLPYKAVLMDVQMQDMDGLETTRRIRAWEKDANRRHFIIGVTAHALAGDREKCLDAGMDDYMSKPIHPDLLEQKLGSLSQAA